MPSLTRLRKNKNDTSASKIKSTISSNSNIIPSYYTSDSAYQRVPFLPDATPYQYAQIGWTNRVMYWVTDNGKKIWNSGYYYLLSGQWGNDVIAWSPAPCIIKPELDIDDYIVDYILGDACAYFVTKKGYVYAGGGNGQGNLGLNDTTDRQAFTRVPASAAVTFGPGGTEKAVRVYTNNGPGSVANRRTFVLTERGNLYGCGNNANYELGVTGNATQQNQFIRCAPAITDIVEVYPGSYSTAVITRNRDLYTWGNNGNGELGVGDTTTRQTATLSATNVGKFSHAWMYYDARRYAFHVKTNGTVWFTGYNGAPSGGGSHSGLGDNTQRTSWTQVTTNLSGKNVIDVICGGYSADPANHYFNTLFLTREGEVWGTGYNGYGALGDGTTTGRSTPVQLIIPSGFPRTDLIIHGGGYSVDSYIGINKETGRMWSVGAWCLGWTGYGFGDFSNTWPNRSATSHRAHYPARECDAPPVIQDGYAKFVSAISINAEETSGQYPTLFVLCSDGTVWARGHNYYGISGTGYVQQLEPSNAYNYTYADNGSFGWRQVKFII